MKTTKKQIAKELDCINSVKGPYPEMDHRIANAIAAAHEPYYELCTFADGRTKRLLNHGAQTRKDIIDRAYDLINDAK